MRGRGEARVWQGKRADGNRVPRAFRVARSPVNAGKGPVTEPSHSGDIEGSDSPERDLGAMRLSLFSLPVVLLAFAACGEVTGEAAAKDEPLKVTSVAFTPTPAPASVMEMTFPYTRSHAVVTLADGSQKTYPLTYHVLHRSGDFVPDWYAGLVVDKAGAPILQARGKTELAAGPFFAPGADGTSLLVIPDAHVDGVKGHTVFLINHLEYETEAPNVDPTKRMVELYRRLPMAMNLTVLDQNPETGALRPVTLSNVDFSAVQGLWTPCNGSTTPWGTHLGSEEYEPDAQVFETEPLDTMNLYFGTLGKMATEGGADPYRYGHIVEVALSPDGRTTPVKHYAMGRLSFELGDVMPDRRTVYFGDDGDDVIRAMFVADKAGDLSAGTLYAAKWKQLSGEDFGSADLDWIRLGHATDAEIEKIVADGVTFTQIWDVAAPAKDGPTCDAAAGFRPIFAYAGTGGDAALTCVKPKEGMQQAAAFLETRRYAAYLGATTEFTKMEGQAHNGADKKLYTVISSIKKGMIAGQNGDRPHDDIKLDGDKDDLKCGVIYESTMSGGRKDTQEQPIASDWVATDMTPLVHGANESDNAKARRSGPCVADQVANPDNVRYSEAMRTLFIGEDSDYHFNNYTWAFNVDTKVPVRIFSAPAGAENTGLSVYDAINGHAYITGNVQHPGAELPPYPDKIDVDLRGLIDPRGIVGYFGGLPAMTR